MHGEVMPQTVWHHYTLKPEAIRWLGKLAKLQSRISVFEIKFSPVECGGMRSSEENRFSAKVTVVTILSGNTNNLCSLHNAKHKCCKIYLCNQVWNWQHQDYTSSHKTYHHGTKNLINVHLAKASTYSTCRLRIHLNHVTTHRNLFS